MEKVVLSTGGTGGHIFPALAVAEELRRRYSNIEILFIGSLYGPEKRLTTLNNIPFVGLNVRGFLGRGLKAIPAGVHMFKALYQARNIIKRFQPNVVAGFGGYASFAPVLSAWLDKRPVIIHEQNAVAGSCNRILAHLATRVCVSLPDTKGIAHSAFISGNPARSVFFSVGQQRLNKTQGKKLLILGGSQGAHALNNFICENLEILNKAGIELRHQTGEKDLENVREQYSAHDLDPLCAEAFIEDMAQAYKWADLILCRAGASTISEICICGLPAIFVPLPTAIHDHQTLNAQKLVESGAAVLIPESKLKNESVLEQIIELFSDKEKLINMSKASQKLAKVDAAAIIVDHMEEIAKKVV